MMRFDRVEKFRHNHPLGFPHRRGDHYGWFEIPTSPIGPILRVMAVNGRENGDGWDHVSISLATRCPTWEEMCKIKDLFWEEDDCVVQFHPPKSDYVNNAKFCLHLWRWTGGEFPRPPSIAVGLKGLNL